jgi:hypothetical protein
MQDSENLVPPAPKRATWNKGKLIGAKSPCSVDVTGWLSHKVGPS